MKIEKYNYLIAIILAALITYLLTLTEVWQLIIIPGIIAGFITYRKPRRGIYSGAIGVLITWSMYIIVLIFTRNAYTLFDQFAGLIFGGLGYGWILIVLIILLGILFGALGGALGSGVALYISLSREGLRNTQEIVKKKVSSAK